MTTQISTALFTIAILIAVLPDVMFRAGGPELAIRSALVRLADLGLAKFMVPEVEAVRL